MCRSQPQVACMLFGICVCFCLASVNECYAWTVYEYFSIRMHTWLEVSCVNISFLSSKNLRWCWSCNYLIRWCLVVWKYIDIIFDADCLSECRIYWSAQDRCIRVTLDAALWLNYIPNGALCLLIDAQKPNGTYYATYVYETYMLTRICNLTAKPLWFVQGKPVTITLRHGIINIVYTATRLSGLPHVCHTHTNTHA